MTSRLTSARRIWSSSLRVSSPRNWSRLSPNRGPKQNQNFENGLFLQSIRVIRMSAIFGIYAGAGGRPDQDELLRLRGYLASRGPDAVGTWSDGEIALG